VLLGHLLAEIFSVYEICVKAQGHSLGITSWRTTFFLCFNFEDCFAMAKFGPNLVVPAKRVPDKKSGDENESEGEKDDNNRQGRESTTKMVRHASSYAPGT